MKKFYTIEKEWKTVSKEEFNKFLKSYPRELEVDYFMEVYTYNDFELANAWPHSIVAKIITEYSDNLAEYQIVANYKDVFNSKTGYKRNWRVAD